MKKVAIIYNSSDIVLRGKKPFKKLYLNEMYTKVSKEFTNNQIQIFYSNYKNISGKKLKKSWYYDKKWSLVEDQEIEAIYDKFETTLKTIKFKQNLKKKIPVLNDVDLEIFTKDKLEVYRTFKAISPDTIKADSKTEIKKFLEKHERVIVKPRFGYGGYGIELITKDSQIKPKKLHIAQEMIKSRHFKGKIYDLRIVVIDGKIEYSFVRTIGEGYITNISQGAIPQLEELIPKTKKIVKQIDNKLKKFKHRVYTVDLMKDTKGNTYLIELNTKPLLNPFYNNPGRKKSQAIKKFIKELSLVFKALIREGV